jgi:outer membrane protein insertion porin family
MKRVLRGIIYEIVLTGLFLTFPFLAFAVDETPPVKLIEIRGLMRIEEDAVRERIGQAVGEALSAETVSLDIKRIYAMGYFDDIRVEVETFEGGIKLVYVIKEKPSVRRVDLQGNQEVEDEKLTEQLTVSPGSIADTVLIQGNADIIRTIYQDEGYALAVVVPIVRELDERNVLVTYQIIEGPKVKVETIAIEGNEAFSDKKIKKHMETSERRWWKLSQFMTQKGFYDKKVISQDMERIKALYHNDGFIKAEVLEPKVEISEDRESMSISVRVLEGDRFTVSSVGFAGNTVFLQDELNMVVDTESGAVISRATLGKDVSTLTGMYTEKGYALANVYPDIQPDEERDEAAVVFRVDEDHVYHVRRINISGNQSTMDKVIRREMVLNEGDVFNSKFLKRSHQKLTNLNFFEEVKFNPAPNVKEKTLDVDVEVAERSTGLLNVGGGYSTTDKILGMVDVTQANLGGRGQYLKFKSEFSSRSLTFEVSFREPWFLDRPVSLDVGAYRTERDYSSYSKKATGGSLGVGRKFWDYWQVRGAYRYEWAEVFDIDENATSVIRDQEGTSDTSSITPSIVRDSRDNFLDPHTGSRNSVSTTIAGLGGENKFWTIDLDSSWFFPVTERTTFGVRGRYGFATGIAGEELPLWERYYAGGISTIRGVRDVGPRDDNGEYIGGEQRLLFNVDYVFPLVPSAGLKGGIFFDAGTAWDGSWPFVMRETAGAGIRWVSPIGPIKVDWAYVLDRKSGEDEYKWEFAMGTFF